MANAGNVDEVIERLERGQALAQARAAERLASAKPYVAAAKVLRKAAQDDAKAVDGPTPERMVAAGGEAKLEEFYEPVEIMRKGVPEVVTVAARRFRVDSGPLRRLQGRKMLHGDHVINLAMATGGERYRSTWMMAGLNNLKAQDASRPVVQGSGGPTTLWRSEREINAFESFCAVGDSMTLSERRVVDAVVLSERDLDDIGAVISGYSDRRQTVAVALHLLRCGLASVCHFWGYLTLSASNEIKGLC